MNGSREVSPVTIVGRITFSKDDLAYCTPPDTIEVGELLAIDDAGAYSYSMASRFLGQNEPISLFLEEWLELPPDSGEFEKDVFAEFA